MSKIDKSNIDKVYAEKLPRIVDFVFDESVASAFPDMIRRSVPGYETIITMLGVIAERHLRADSNVYDLGCSLGAAMLSIHSRIADSSIGFIGVDNSAPMLEQCRNNLQGVIEPARFNLLHCDVRDVEIKDAGMVILNFTLQFIDPADRLALLTRIHSGLKPGGVLVLSEKVSFEDSDEEILQQSMHDQFKIANGYSELEIAQKRAALENIMTPDSGETHRARLRRAGFPRVSEWFRAFNFCSFMAIK
ncbi:carboxy-S-adenosyl-L-methionine synthase CmoA [Candidatus Spongiihabitans sp.]|uniref:carboxy-S-adenosyl-L-methionine synthase CmoA n=1 Tax=Candidatus Spongiihabitans sp. TaxID=3101308 RepID=UPI003C7A7B39